MLDKPSSVAPSKPHQPATAVPSDALPMRRFVVDDIASIVDLVARYVPELPNYEGILVEPKRVQQLLEVNQSNVMFLCNVLLDHEKRVIGGIGACCTASVVSYQRVTDDIFLFVTPEHRTLYNATRLIMSYVEWARSLQAVIIGATTTSGYRMDGLGRILERLGFRRVGSLYHFRLG